MEREGERRIIARNGMNISQEANDTSPSHPLPHPELQWSWPFQESCAQWARRVLMVQLTLRSLLFSLLCNVQALQIS